MSAVAEITLRVEPCLETGGFVARWDAPGGGGITTQGDSFAELDAMIADAVDGYFEPGQRPKRVRLHFTEDPVLAIA
jgi:predicted RNase H-like HicB family nuclease